MLAHPNGLYELTKKGGTLIPKVVKLVQTSLYRHSRVGGNDEKMATCSFYDAIKVKSVKREIEQFEAELYLLKQNKVAPGPNSSKILGFIPAKIKYQPLHSFIKNHTAIPDQTELFLSLLTFLLFVPVIKSKNDISKVLDIFAEKKEDILLPVFHEDSLNGFLQKHTPVFNDNYNSLLE